MKSKITLFISLLCTSAAVSALPLTIINNTKETKTCIVTLKNKKSQKVHVAPGDKWTSPSADIQFKSISWEDYNAQTGKFNNYTVTIKQDAPKMVDGGAFVIGDDGWYMYDYKQGHGVQFGQAVQAQ